MIKKIFPILFAVLLFVSCSSDSDDSGSTNTPASTGINGVVQKGDFIKGSSVTIQELDDNFVPTGKSYQTATTDDLGAFSMPVGFTSPYLEITTSGYYFNEITGNLSTSTITLHTIVESSQTNVNVNVLTTLERERIKYLVFKSGMTFAEARAQAEQEILQIFNITDSLINFSQMDISQSGDSNAALLAISAILQGSNTPGELSELISNIIDDISADGTIDTTAHIEELKNNSAMINLALVKANMQERYANLGLPVTVPTFENFCDSDGDGTLNKNDVDFSIEDVSMHGATIKFKMVYNDEYSDISTPISFTLDRISFSETGQQWTDVDIKHSVTDPVRGEIQEIQAFNIAPGEYNYIRLYFSKGFTFFFNGLFVKDESLDSVTIQRDFPRKFISGNRIEDKDHIEFSIDNNSPLPLTVEYGDAVSLSFIFDYSLFSSYIDTIEEAVIAFGGRLIVEFE